MKLDQYLLQSNLTEAAFAALSGLTQATVHRLRKGQISPSLQSMRAIMIASKGTVEPNDWLDIVAQEDNRIVRLGSGYAVSIAEQQLQELDLHEGDAVEIELRRKFDAVEFQRRLEALNSLDYLRGRLPADFKFDREEANAR